MKKLMILFWGFLVLTTACDTRRFDACPDDRKFGEWGVIQKSGLFGTDSMYFLTNPIGAVYDSLYYNANYTDSYFISDSTRITMQFMLNDTVKLFVDRRYIVEANPDQLYLLVSELDDTVKANVKEFMFTKFKNSDQLYHMKGSAALQEVLMTGKPLSITTTNYPKNYDTNPNAQNYSWLLYTEGFEDALKLCYSLNNLPFPKPAVDSDSVKMEKDKKMKEKRELKEERRWR